MNRHSWKGAALALLTLAAAGCNADAASSDLPVPANLTLSRSDASSALAASLVGDVAGPGRVDLSQVDSVIVVVDHVDVLPDSLLMRCHPPQGDSVNGFHPRPDVPRGLGGPMGPPPGCGRPRHPRGPGGPPPGDFRPVRPDSLRPDSGWGRRMDHWYTLEVTGNGHLDLLALPTDSANGLELAAGSLPAGDYGAARLFITDAAIYFNTAVTTEGGLTLKPDTGYAVHLPRAGARRGIITNAGFTVPEGGGTVSLVFNASASIAGAIVTDSGKVIVVPVMRPARR